MNLLTVSGIGMQGEEGFSLRDISFLQKKNQRIAIAGETGSGKSSLLKIIAGLYQPDTGKVKLLDKKVDGPADKLVPGHPEIAYLSQHFELPKSLRVEQVLDYANTMSDEDAFTLYKVCQIDHLLKRRTDQLSGGERQRIAMARLLITSPQLLLLDEPFSHLDLVHKNILKAVIRDVGETLRITCILVSHDPVDTLPWADKIIILQNGKIIQQGTPEKVYTRPVSEYVAGLLGEYVVLTENQLTALGLKKKKGKNGLLRPEGFKVVAKGKGGLAGKVEQIVFLGSHTAMDIRIDQSRIRVWMGDKNFSKGDNVRILLSTEPLWVNAS